MMKISQIGSRQFVHDAPTFVNRHKDKNIGNVSIDQYSVKNNSAEIIKTAKEINQIIRETDYIKENNSLPPSRHLFVI